jgi:prepilin-type N-terminal cleavage/methylation domain-containing protein
MRPEKRQAFTLVELMVVVLILGALTAIAVPRITGGSFSAGVNACRKNVDIINSQIELYHSRTGSWPVDIGEVTKDPNYFPDGPPKCPFNTPYVLDKNNRVPDHKHLDKKEVKKIPIFLIWLSESFSK